MASESVIMANSFLETVDTRTEGLRLRIDSNAQPRSENPETKNRADGGHRAIADGANECDPIRVLPSSRPKTPRGVRIADQTTVALLPATANLRDARHIIGTDGTDLRGR